MKSKTIIIFFIILSIAIIIQFSYLLNTEINSDEAIVGLMGMPIILGLQKSGCMDFVLCGLIRIIVSGLYAYFIQCQLQTFLG